MEVHEGSIRIVRTLALLATLVVAASACTRLPRRRGPRDRPVQDRILERWRRRQRLPRGAGLHRQGPGQGARRPGLRADHIHRNTDAAGQLSDLRDLIAKDVNAIVFNPNDPDALNPALDEADAAGIKTVSVDAYVTDPNTWNLYNNQVKYAELGAKWLFDQMGGTGTVWYTRGLAGHPADSDRDVGFKNVLKKYPNIKVVPNPCGVVHGLGPGDRHQITNDFISSGGYDKIQGIWASGMGTQIIDAIKAASKPFVPIADADIGGFVTQLLDPTGYPGPRRRGRDQHGRRRRRRRQPRLKLLNGRDRRPVRGRRPAEHRPARPADPGRQHHRRGQGRPEGVAVASPAWTRSGRSACRSPAGRPTTPNSVPCGLQGRIAAPRSVHAGDAGSPASPAPSPHRQGTDDRSPPQTCCSRPPASPRRTAPSWPSSRPRSPSGRAKSMR